MIIVRAPLRVTLGGGGTDVPSFYERHGGMCISAAIDKYVYITVHDTFVDEAIIKYSKMERVHPYDEIEHPIIREAFREHHVQQSRIEISSMADLPSGTGLGSSSSFTVALLKALHLWTEPSDHFLPKLLAEAACHIEIDLLGEPIGKQDQYIASYGDIRCLEFGKQGSVGVAPVPMDPDTRTALEENLLLFFTGYARPTADVMRSGAGDMDANLLQIFEVANRTYEVLQTGNLIGFAGLLSKQWLLKRERLTQASNTSIDRWWCAGMDAGALGGKLVGAGGGGFLMFYTEDKKRALREAMRHNGLEEVRFRFDREGARAILQ